MWRLCRVGNQKKENYHNFVKPVLCIFLQVWYWCFIFFEVYGDFCQQISWCLVWSNFVQLMGPHRPFTINLAGRQPKQVNYEKFTKHFQPWYPEDLKLDFIEMILVLHLIGSVLPFLSSGNTFNCLYLSSIFWRVWIGRTNGQKHQ